MLTYHPALLPCYLPWLVRSPVLHRCSDPQMLSVSIHFHASLWSNQKVHTGYSSTFCLQATLVTTEAMVQDLSQKNTLLAKHGGNGCAPMPAVQSARVPTPPHQPVAAQPPPPAAVVPPVRTQSHQGFSVVESDGCDSKEEIPSAKRKKVWMV